MGLVGAIEMGGSGNIVVIMDSNWVKTNTVWTPILDPGGVQRNRLIQNIAWFLAGGSSASVLLTGNTPSGWDGDYLPDSPEVVTAALQQAGHTVTRNDSETLPADITPYDVIFDIEIGFPHNETDIDRLVNFVRSGKGLYLTGEWHTYIPINDSIQAILDQFVDGVIVGGVTAEFGDPTNSPLNGGNAYGINSTPNSVSFITHAAAGVLAGDIADEQVIAYVNGYITGAVWAGVG